MATWTLDLVSKERDWIAQRLGWNLTSQTVLIAAISFSSSKDKQSAIILSAVPLLGMIISAFSSISIFAAYARICEIEGEWKQYQDREGYLPVHPFGTEKVRLLGSISSKYIPVAMLVFWAAFLVAHWLKL